jgi:hypothetical protein
LQAQNAIPGLAAYPLAVLPLERLQWYADETSYSFSAMTDGMSKFVAAGASLEEAEQSMEGIANWAATAGVGAQSYKFLNVVQQLSQAAGSGVVMGQDWSSIETATMATRGFKQAVIDAAKEEKTLVEIDGKLYAAGVKLTKSNKEQHEVTVDNLSKTLRDKWLTFGVLKKILDSYAKDPAAFQAAQVARPVLAVRAVLNRRRAARRVRRRCSRQAVSLSVVYVARFTQRNRQAADLADRQCAVGHCDVVEHPTVVDAVVEFVDLVVLDAVGSHLKGTESRLTLDEGIAELRHGLVLLLVGILALLPHRHVGDSVRMGVLQ